MVVGSLRQYAMGETLVRILKGPYHFGISFFVPVMCRFFLSSQTWSSGLRVGQGHVFVCVCTFSSCFWESFLACSSS
jgi:hypothetical protein